MTDEQVAIADETQNPWKSAIINELVVDCIYQAEHEADPRRALADIIEWNMQVALDPKVSADARKLQQEAIDAALESVAQALENGHFLYEYSPPAMLAKEAARVIRAKFGTNPLVEAQAEVAHWKALASRPVYAQLAEAQAKITELERQLEEARKDTERMDWLENNASYYSDAHFAYLDVPLGQPGLDEGGYDTLREMFDAAMKESDNG